MPANLTVLKSPRPRDVEVITSENFERRRRAEAEREAQIRQKQAAQEAAQQRRTYRTLSTVAFIATGVIGTLTVICGAIGLFGLAVPGGIFCPIIFAVGQASANLSQGGESDGQS